VKAWLDKGGEDLAAARVLKEHAPHLDSVVGFHCQQAAEKYMKALLVAMESEVPRAHDLDALLVPLVASLPELAAIEEAASYLSGFAVIPRYPSFQPQAGNASARSRRAWVLATDIVDAVRRQLHRPGPSPEDTATPA